MYKWSDFELLSPEHEWDLERSAAMFSLKGLDRARAEAEAFLKYKRLQHAKAAAHHLKGMENTKYSRNFKDSQKHYAMYSLHLAQMGLNPMEPVPAEIAAHKTEDISFDKFVPHPADVYLNK